MGTLMSLTSLFIQEILQILVGAFILAINIVVLNILESENIIESIENFCQLLDHLKGEPMYF